VDVVANAHNHYEFRVAVRDGTQWYLSGLSGTADTTFDLLTSRWGTYDPLANLQANPINPAGARGLTGTPHTFTDITAVGLYAEVRATPTSGGAGFSMATVHPVDRDGSVPLIACRAAKACITVYCQASTIRPLPANLPDPEPARRSHIPSRHPPLPHPHFPA